MLNIRPYSPKDYEAIKLLYLQTDLYGGHFSEERDSKEKLSHVIKNDPQSILICEEDDKILGIISLIENGRVAWLFRFAVAHSQSESAVARALHEKACRILSSRGHSEVLIYSPHEDLALSKRYLDLGFTQGSTYFCYWQNITSL